MQRTLAMAILAILMATSPESASACAARAPLDLSDIRSADVVVIGRISNYEHVLDPVIRKQHKADLEKLPDDAKRELERIDGFITDYVRFRVSIDKVLFGSPPKEFVMTWDNSTFGEPETMEPGSYLIAAWMASSNRLPLRGASATVFPNREPDKMTLLQAPCSEGFLFPVGSKNADAVLQILKSSAD